MKRLRSRRVILINATVFSVLMVLDITLATVSIALTGGPSQPEVAAFTPVSTSDLVDLSSGDFNYNIPLLDVGGYPINISYNSGASMDQEASWVGLGWNINPGVVNRNMRSLPDDFNGLDVTKEFYMKSNISVGIDLGLGTGTFGIEAPVQLGASFNFSLGIKYNNYNGISLSQSLGASIDMQVGSSESKVGLGLSLKASDGGLDVDANASFSRSKDTKENFTRKTNSSIGLGFNSRQGMGELSLSVSASVGNKADEDLEAGSSQESNDSGGTLGIPTTGTSISFMPNTYTPSLDVGRSNFSGTFSAKLAPHLFGGDLPQGSVSAYFTKNKIKETSKDVPSYGYLNAHHAGVNSQHDFNRENDGAYTKNVDHLPVTNHSYDLFSVNGQGVGGMYRPYRNDVGVIHDNYTQSSGDDINIGAEFGVGALAHGGVDVKYNHSESHSSVWSGTSNPAYEKLKFESSRVDDPDRYGYNSDADPVKALFEPSYFRQVGELSVDPELVIDGSDGVVSYLEKIGGYDPVRVDLNSEGIALKKFKVIDEVPSEGGSDLSFPADPSRFRQEKRKSKNQLFSYLSVGEAINHGIRPSNLPERVKSGANHADYADQIGEITILKNDGARYIYGKPLYNIKQKEVSFTAVEPHNVRPSPEDGTISYLPKDAGIKNKNGIDHFYSSTTLPAFAHSFAITEILSSDYSDVDDVLGPSIGDYGNYTRFDYKAPIEYKWRSPYTDANYNEGFRSDENDDKASYIYGEKELSYLEYIFTKTHVARFVTTQRQDAHEASGEYAVGSIPGPQSMLKLDKILLYALPEYEKALANEIPVEDIVPIKVVNFEYDYMLGNGVYDGSTTTGKLPNSNSAVVNATNGGKLTLKKIYFTYGKSGKSKFSKYEFKYDTKNYAYDTKAYDIWGNYKPSNMDKMSNDCCELATPEFPYTSQTEVTNDYASAWHISEIKLPSGGSIKVKFESDDYSSVQDKRNMQMFRVIGSAVNHGENENYHEIWRKEFLEPQSNGLPLDEDSLINVSGITNKLYANNGDGRRWMIMAAEEELTTIEWEKVLGDFDNNSNVNDPIQFKFLTDVSKEGTKDFEYIPGYARIKKSHITTTQSQFAWIFFNGVKKENKPSDENNPDENNPDDTVGKIHPVSKAAWNFARKYLPKKAYNQSEADGLDGLNLQGIVNTIGNASIINSLINTIQGPNGALKADKKGKTFVQGKSWVRLNSPKEYKYGGGSRVKQIVSIDNWSEMTGGIHSSSQFGQRYSYGSGSKDDPERNYESWGVASYEPLMSKENPWVQPLHYGTPSKYMIPDFIEKPLGVSFFPSPTITYSKVEVKDITFDQDLTERTVSTNGTGKTVHEFYTTKDFPTDIDFTDLEPVEDKSGLLGKLLKLDVKNLMTVSQGYQITINDMDGKPKSTRIYPEGSNEPISGVDYLYGFSQESQDITEAPFSVVGFPEYTLDNTVVTIDSDGSISRAEVGVEVDFVADMREQQNYDESVGLNGNLAVILAAILPVPVPTILPASSAATTRFRSVVMTKVINRRGILRETRAFDNGASVSTKNLAYDANTGQVLLTETKNEFNDKIYNLNIPAYWAYDKMGQASNNIGYRTVITTSLGKITEGGKYLVSGDEIALPSGLKAWIWSPEESSDKYVINKNGSTSLVLSNEEVKVIRSGYKNLHASSMTSMTLMTNPLLENQGSDTLASHLSLGDETSKIIDVSAIEYSDKWKTYAYKEEPPQDYTLTDCGNGAELVDQVIAMINTLIGFGFPYDGIVNYEQLLEESTDLFYNSYTDEFLDCESITIENSFGSTSLLPDEVRLSCPDGGSCHIDFRTIGDFSWDDISYLRYPIAGDPVPNNLTPFNILGDNNFEGTYTGYLTAVLNVNGGSTLGSIEIKNGNCAEVCVEEEVDIDNFDYSECRPKVGSPINPFVSNIRGQYRPSRSFAYLGERNYKLEETLSDASTDIRKDGTYKSFNPYWNVDDFGTWTSDTSGNWTWTSSITEFNPYGPEIENINALYQYSGALFGYNNTLPIAVGANTTVHQLAYDGFEDYEFYPNYPCFKRHFAFDLSNSSISQAEAHTGVNSLRLYSGQSASCIRSLDNIPGDDYVNDDPIGTVYILRNKDVLGEFGPETYDVGTAYQQLINDEPTDILDLQKEKQYILSYWVKETSLQTHDLNEFNYNSLTTNVRINGSVLPLQNPNSSEIIEGWVRREYTFLIPAGASGDIELFFENQQNSGKIIYVDDVRIHPSNGSMKSYVYHPENLRLLAELDDNNFATIYEYDSEGRLLRIKKETEKGIMTIQESKTHSPISNE